MADLICLIMAMFVLTLLCAQTGCAADAREVLYVSVGQAGRIDLYDLDLSDGRLTKRDSVLVGEVVGAVGVSANQKYMYVDTVRDGQNEVASLAIGDDGGLKLLGHAPALARVTYVSTDRSGRWLLTACYGRGAAAVQAIDADGVVRQEPHHIVETARNAHAILIDPSNRYAYVPHTGPNRIWQFRFDATAGKLIANDPMYVEAPAGVGPRHYAYHPTLDRLYAVNELIGGVSVYQMDQATGCLTELQTLSSTPDDFNGKNTGADIHITPDGRFVYMSNRGHDTLAGYRIDPESGRITLIDYFPTENWTREFEIDPSGQFLYAAGQRSHRMTAYRINPSTGLLKRLKTYEVGKGPAWVTVLRFD